MRMSIFLKDGFKWDAVFFNRHCWEALISSSCVGTVMWQHWQCVILIQEMFSLLELGQSGDVIGCTWNCFESGPSSPTHQNRWDFLRSFSLRSLLVFAGICFESGYVQGRNLEKQWLLKGGSASSQCKCHVCHMYSYVVYTNSNKTRQSLPQIQLVSGL